LLKQEDLIKVQRFGRLFSMPHRNSRHKRVLPALGWCNYRPHRGIEATGNFPGPSALSRRGRPILNLILPADGILTPKNQLFFHPSA
jgi:hypothetical protein